MIPMIKTFIKHNQVKNFTVVADAVMISASNIKELKKKTFITLLEPDLQIYLSKHSNYWIIK
jgi:transposase